MQPEVIAVGSFQASMTRHAQATDSETTALLQQDIVSHAVPVDGAAAIPKPTVVAETTASSSNSTVIAESEESSYLFSAWMVVCTLTFLAACAGLVAYTSISKPVESYEPLFTDFDESTVKKPTTAKAIGPTCGFLKNMPPISFSAGYLLCWAFPLWTIVQIGYWGYTQKDMCSNSQLPTTTQDILFFGHSLGSVGNLNAVSSTRPMSWVTMIAAAVTILASAVAVKVGVLHNEEPEAAPDRSALIDNAKVGSIVCIIFGHVLWYNTTGEYHDKDSWFNSSKSLPYFMGILEFNINAACFLSGCVMRRPVNLARFFNLLFDLLLPCLIWTYFLKGFLHENFETANWTWSTFQESLAKVVQGQNYQEEWYLQALILWRLFSYFTGMLNTPIVFAMACFLGGMGGYHNLWTLRYNFDTASGFLLMFVFGLLCPLEKLTKKIPNHLALQALGLVLMVGFPLVQQMLGPLPDNHLSYSQGASAQLFNALQHANANGSCLTEFNLFWTRRVLKNVMALLVVLTYVVLVVPRRECFMSSLGKYTLYPYLFHEYFNFWRDRLVVELSLPMSTSSGMHALFYSTTAVYSVLVFCLLASPPFRWIFSPFLEFSWLKAQLFPSTPNVHGTAAQSAPSVSSGKLESLNSMAPVAYTDGKVDPALNEGDWRLLTDTYEELAEERKFYELPRMRGGAERFYKLMIYTGSVIAFAFWFGLGIWGLPALIPSFDMAMDFTFHPPNFWGQLIRLMTVFSFCAATIGRPFLQYLRVSRLCEALQPAPCEPSGLIHAVIIPTYKEPLSVLRMTLTSLQKQTFDSRKIHIVLATEARDSTAEESFRLLTDEFGPCFADMMKTVHTLCEGEIAGKSSNENHAVRELYKKLVPDHNPYRVMVTICDVDSLFAPRYIEQLDWSFQQHPNPSMLIYDGPINTYRNFFDADIFIRAYETFRCHLAFSKIWDTPVACQSNYSLTLGMCREINFWCPDNTPEDFHTTMKAYIHTHGATVVAPVWSIISNDLVSGWGDRYVQAKRHAWGVTEAMWSLSTYKQMPVPVWVKLSAWVYWDQIGQEILGASWFFLMPGFWRFVIGINSFSRTILVGSIVITYIAQWIEFVAIEIVLWSRVLPASEDFPPLKGEEKALMVLSWIVYPVTSFIAKFVFGTIPRLHCLVHSYLSTELAYIVAPKAQKELCNLH